VLFWFETEGGEVKEILGREVGARGLEVLVFFVREGDVFEFCGGVS